MIDTPNISAISSGHGDTNSANARSNQTAILNIPAGLQKLQIGSIIEGVVITKDINNNTQLQINQQSTSNELTISGKIPLAKNSNILLKILANHINNNGSTDFKAQIISINGQEPTIPKGVTGEALKNYNIVRAVLPANVLSQPATTQSTNDATLLSGAKGAILNATIIKPDSGAGKYLPQNARLHSAAPSPQGAGQSSEGAKQSGSIDQVKLHVIATNNPTSTTNNIAKQNPYTAQGYNAYQNSGNQSPITGQRTESLTAAQAITNFATRSNTPTQNIAQVTNNLQFNATVIGTERSGDVLLSSPLGTLKLPVSANLQPNTILTLEVISHLKTQIAAPTDKLTASNYKQSLTGANSAFETLYSTLQSIDKTLITQIFPNVEKQAAAKLLWFIFNTQNGSASSWLAADGKNILNKDEHKPLLKKLDGAFAQIKALFNQPNEAGWHSLVFPFYDGEELQYGRFYTRDNQTASDDNQSKDVRFLVEIDFEKLGELQLDGFVKHRMAENINKNVNPKQFDLYIRSKKPFDDVMKTDIIALFEESLEATNISGSLSFQEVKKFPIHPDSNNSDDGQITV